MPATSSRMPSLAAVTSLLALGGVLFQPARAQPTFRADKAHEDTVRVLILSNLEAAGKCDGPTRPVGPRTRDFVLASLRGLPGVVSLPAADAAWSDVAGAWPGKLPHVIVHVNAGWQSRSGEALEAILNTAADSAVGLVSIGDDAASFADRTFGFRNVDNVPEPMGDARQFRSPASSLWIDLEGGLDTAGPGSILRHTVAGLGRRRLHFLPVEPEKPDPAGAYRCQADADRYAVEPAFADKVAFLGFQRATDGQDTIGGPRELQVIAAFQDKVRRGVALSYQPQFLADSLAAHQLTYDAVIYASFAHRARDPLGRPDTLPRVDPPVRPPDTPPKPQPPPPGIREVAGHPPVAGRNGALLWIPPVGYREGVPFAEDPWPPPGGAPAGTEGNLPVPIPPGVSLVRVVGEGRYLARVALFDHLGQFVRRFTQSFGYRGELDNPARAAQGGRVGYLVWDQRDHKGARAGQGVYLWKVEFVLEDGRRVWRTLRTGLIRP